VRLLRLVGPQVALQVSAAAGQRASWVVAHPLSRLAADHQAWRQAVGQQASLGVDLLV
jgi:hypothetical protein